MENENYFSWLNDEDSRFLKKWLLWIQTHPSSDLRFNKELKPIRRDILKNLANNILDGKWRSIDIQSIRPLFWSYFRNNKKIPNSKNFDNIKIAIDWETVDISLNESIKLLNFIKSQIDLVLAEILEYRKMFFDDTSDIIYSTGEYSLSYDEQNKHYLSFLENRFLQYGNDFDKDIVDIKKIIYYLILANKLRYESVLYKFSFSGIVQKEFVNIPPSVFLGIIKALELNSNQDLIRKI